ncbi:MAG: hypothetical protein OEY06_02140 [Gammaproteobacteria bacterium]|nr:hypothetical protein [Gammaproteobacteria bacterium]
MNKSLVALAVVTAASFMSSTAFAGKYSMPSLSNPNPAPLTVTNSISEVNGHVGGFVDSAGNVNGDMMNPDNVTILYPVAGVVNATVTDMRTGVTIGTVAETGDIAATVKFPTSFFGLMGDWSALPETMAWTMDDFAMNLNGSTFNFAEELTGRAFPHLGPVENPMVTGTMALRMAGCAGVREVSGEGDYAGQVGTLCMNGTFTFDQNFNGVGVSNCTVALHTPIQ